MKNRISKLLAIVALSFTLLSCNELMQVAQQTMDAQNGTTLDSSTIVSGLKEALIIGTQNSAQTLGKKNGYYGDELIKIMLPPEADVIVNNISKVPGGEKLLNDLIVRLNRTAEDAVDEAKPIFINSIREMTIQDGVTILRGSDDEATQYLRAKTYNNLYQLYLPKIQNSLDKKLIGNISTTQSWNLLTSRWNEVARSPIGTIAGFKAVDIALDDYITNKALDGIFVKIADEEKLIREDPAARVTNLLKRVFGSQQAAW